MTSDLHVLSASHSQRMAALPKKKKEGIDASAVYQTLVV